MILLTIISIATLLITIIITLKLKKMGKELDQLTEEVSQTTTIMGSAVTLLQGLKKKLDEAGTDKAKLKALSDDLDASQNDLAAAITANTPTEETEDPGEEGTGTGG